MAVFDALLPIFTQYGYLAVFLMLLICGFGIPIPEDVTLVTGGVIAGMGFADVNTMVFVGLSGVLIGDGIMFGLGRRHGPRIASRHRRSAFCGGGARCEPPGRRAAPAQAHAVGHQGLVAIGRVLEVPGQGTGRGEPVEVSEKAAFLVPR